MANLKTINEDEIQKSKYVLCSNFILSTLIKELNSSKKLTSVHDDQIKIVINTKNHFESQKKNAFPNPALVVVKKELMNGIIILLPYIYCNQKN